MKVISAETYPSLSVLRSAATERDDNTHGGHDPWLEAYDVLVAGEGDGGGTRADVRGRYRAFGTPATQPTRQSPTQNRLPKPPAVRFLTPSNRMLMAAQKARILEKQRQAGSGDRRC